MPFSFSKVSKAPALTSHVCSQVLCKTCTSPNQQYWPINKTRGILYHAESKSLSRLMWSSIRKYETGIVSLATYNPESVLCPNSNKLSIQAPNGLPKDWSGFYRQRDRGAGWAPLRIIRYKLTTGNLSGTANSIGDDGHSRFPSLVHKDGSTLDISKSPGPDQLHPKLLK